MARPPIVEDTEDKPLDPAIERVRGRLVRLLAVSIGVMMVGLMAVLGAIVYKLGQNGEPAVARNGSITLPEGAAIVETELDGDRLLVRHEQDGVQTLSLFDIRTGELIGRLAISGAATLPN